MGPSAGLSRGFRRRRGEGAVVDEVARTMLCTRCERLATQRELVKACASVLAAALIGQPRRTKYQRGPQALATAHRGMDHRLAQSLCRGLIRAEDVINEDSRCPGIAGELLRKLHGALVFRRETVGFDG